MQTTTTMPPKRPTVPQDQLTPERIMQMAWGFAPPLLIGAAVRHKLFDALAEAPLNARQLAQRTQTDPRAVRMVLDALTSLGLTKKDAEQRYALGAEANAFLVTHKPSFQGGLFKHLSTQLVPNWLQLEEILTTGRPATSVNRENTGGQFFEQFVEDIFPMSYTAATVLGESLGLAKATRPLRVLDLAAGSGVWGIALARQSKFVQVTAVDWPAVIPVTRRIATRFEVADRFTFVEGDLDQVDFAGPHDVAVLGHILHSEGPERGKALIAKTAAALAPGGRIAIAEFISNDDRTGPANAAIFAVNMLVNTEHGDTFTLPEISSWLTAAGMTDIRTLDAPGPSPLILANKPGK